MNEFFKFKTNLFLLTVFSFLCVFFYIRNVGANDSYLLQKDSVGGTSFTQRAKNEISVFEKNAVTSDLKYILRANNEEVPLGYADSTFIRCFVDMGPVDFLPRYKFKSQDINGEVSRMYGFSTPLVGDLNGDGKPEIVVLGINDGQVGLAATAIYIYILNGQTGKHILKFALPSSWNLRGNYWHGSPCQLALMKLDSDSPYSQIVCALGYNGLGTQFSKHVMCWQTNEKTFDASIPITESAKLTMLWKSDTRYDAYGANNSNLINNELNFSKPLPHIVDIDGNGTPEIIVYNKIYDAATGILIMKLDDLASSVNNATAYVGQNRRAAEGDYDIPFAYIYDIDFDNKYDIIAGGKVYYDIDLTSKTCRTIAMPNIADGYTAVADINGDGLPEVVMASYPTTTLDNITVNVWTPNLVRKEGENIVPGTAVAELLATRSFTTSITSTGNHSNIFVGDIDGKLQNGKKFPEISILSGRYIDSPGYTISNVPVHPNWAGTLPSSITYSSEADGTLVSWTWDDNETDKSKKLKVSFILEHDDSSFNTGFTLFDFDNDGVQDICYRDEHSLRIISARTPLVRLNETSTDVIRFKQSVGSYTGFENPVVADVDGDASSDMVVLGHQASGNHDYSYVYAVEGANGDLAPAPRVWNQYSYSPLKVNEDLTIPKKVFHPLDDAYAYYLSESDRDRGVKTYIYNNTIAQVPIYSVSPDKVAKPIVSIPDAKILDLAIVINNATSGTLNFKLTNTGNSTVNPTVPINIYVDGVYNSNLSTVVGSGGLFVNDTLPYSFNISNPLSIYTIVVGATIDNQENLQPINKYEDCNWADNIDEVATFLPKDDAVTVVQYGTALIDVLANDILQDECQVQTLKEDNVTTPGGSGVMSGDFGNVRIMNNKLFYTAPASYTGGVVKLSYNLTCSGVQKTANVYIYVLESCTFGFASCAGSSYNVCVKENPSGIKFGWYSSEYDSDFLGENAPNIPSLVTDKVYYVKPNFSAISDSPYKIVQFPKGKIIVKALNSSEKLNVRWTGEVDTDWHNPDNWVQVLTNGGEAPVSWTPISCVNVVIPGEVERYPELTSVVECSHIHMGNRAMIGGIHYLVYAEASVEIAFSPSEKNRFLMWSAPLKDMYTGDYHFLNTNDTPNWGYVYMNFFQSANPDYEGSVEREKTFTATFGSTGTPLPLGTAFNVKVMTGNDDGLAFPKLAASYTDARGNSSGALTRTNAKRFITDGALSADGALSLPVNGENEFSLIQVVNPFMAYLNMGAFLGANSSVLSGSFSIWNGDVNADFVTVLPYDEEGEQRFVIDDSELQSTSAGYMPPLQSFFVAKKVITEEITTLSMNSATMTSTYIPSENGNTTYVLRSATRGASEAASLLRVTANQGDKANSTVLLRRKGAEQAYKAGEDAGKAFNHGAPISVYTLSGSREAIAINASDDFSADVKLGIRLRNPSVPVSLSFDGLDGFGRKVYLVDHALADMVVDLEKENTYTFIAGRQSPGDVTELNDRFSLRFGANATGIEDVLTGDISVRSYDNYVSVSSSSIFNRVEIVNMSGYKVSDSIVPTQYVRVPLPTGQVYIVKVTQGDKVYVRKVLLD